MLFCLQAYDYAHFLFFLHFITYWLLLWTKRHSNCQTIVISFKNLREALDEPFRENGKRFCINFFFKSQPKPYRGLGKKKKAIGESSNFHSSGIVLGASACTHSYPAFLDHLTMNRIFQMSCLGSTVKILRTLQWVFFSDLMSGGIN